MTILGLHSIGELRDWLAAMDFEIGEIDRTHEAFAATWTVRDPAAAGEWASEWRALRARYATAHANAKGAIARAILMPDAVTPAEDEWQTIDRALRKTPGVTSRGDLQDLYARLVAARGSVIDLSRMPQPTATDADLRAYQAADGAVRAVVGATPSRAAATTTVFLLLGGACVASLVALRTVLK